MFLCPSWPSGSSYSWMTMARNFGGESSFQRIVQSHFLLTVSNTVVRSTQVVNNPSFCFRHFS